MRKNNKLYIKSILLMTAMILSVTLSGCIGDLTNDESDKEMITITDAFGRTVTLPDNPEKIAVSGSGSMRYFVYMEISDRAVAVDYQDSSSFVMTKDNRPYSIAHPEIRDNPMLGTAKGAIDAERLLAANPDVLFISAYGPEDIASADQIQEKTGIPVVLFYVGNYVTEKEQIDTTLRMLGKIFHKDQRAEDLISYFDGIIVDLQNRIKDVPTPDKTVYIGGISYNGAHGLNGSDPTYLPFTVLKANNVATEMLNGTAKTGYVAVSKEKILEWDPDVIFVDLGTQSAAGGGALVELKNDVSYKELTAVKKGEIYTVNPHTSMNVNHETSLANCYFVGKILYPEQFADIEPAEKADEIYTFVVGKPVFDVLNSNVGNIAYTKADLTK
ncbi:iron ABC transporter substrate-binding protein [Methanimicrococcus blatticola]|uniref:Iron complex transport system substrate-binding protein n=1 Tax=Methanimicrococcus blatticola TaxID=91560 RepID=A0A484F773_9EURY|nr:iron ABC transporter substrate-binding protein [Methanimicrococcus blatticola]MBZ3936141.1 iron ABC transporter substrate-binding protein [Methanimicrococcus blatticola]MCC2508384.1 iron ABC transporter substrate-binding protein [Methanimicrococcus blatticola]TDQ70163.1 iron complex transport system substrate-binding protein [Methanimicrococcus blatticola]